MAGIDKPTIILLTAHHQKFCAEAVKILPKSSVVKQTKNDFFLPILSFSNPK